VNLQSIYHSKILLATIPEIDALGLVVKDDQYLDPLIAYLKHSNTDFIFSEIGVPLLSKPEILETGVPFFIASWQDQHESNKLTFDGIIDRKGRYKTDYFKLKNSLQNSSINVEFPNIRILKPATLIYQDLILDYYALFYNSIEGCWNHGNELKDFKFEWSLVKCDIYGNYIAIKDIGDGDKISIKIPRDPERYKLLLTIIKGDIITTTITSLNTPLIQ
ncbi:MAG TPA: hypothetical protein VK470_19315, partial [Bacteroidota bacterium]|nr:hypothetical protein [Bacteroidota bacterium]